MGERREKIEKRKITTNRFFGGREREGVECRGKRTK